MTVANKCLTLTDVDDVTKNDVYMYLVLFLWIDRCHSKYMQRLEIANHRDKNTLLNVFATYLNQGLHDM